MIEEKQSKTSKCQIGSRLSPELYNSFINYLQNETKRMPSKQLLIREMSQTMNISAKKTNNTIRKKFRNWSSRMTYSNGILLHKSTKKIIIPEFEFRLVIKSIHCSSAEHLNVTQTVRQLKTRYTWRSKNFGMDLMDVLNVITECQNQNCRQRAEAINAIKAKSKPNSTQNDSILLNLELVDNTSDQIEDNLSHSLTQNSVKTSPELLANAFIGSTHFPNLFNDLIFKIHFMKIQINLSKVSKFRRTHHLKESLLKCEQLTEELRSSLTARM